MTISEDIAHVIRSRVQWILSFSELWEKDDSPEKRKEYLDRMRKESKELINFLDRQEKEP